MITKYIPHKPATILIITGLVLCFTIAYAHMSFRSPNTPPRPTMLEAYSKALRALGAETNTFYCVSATSQMQCALTYAVDTEWHVTFNSTNGQFRDVIVPTTGSIIIWTNMPAGF